MQVDLLRPHRHLDRVPRRRGGQRDDNAVAGAVGQHRVVAVHAVDPATDQVRRADEAGHETRRRALVDLPRRAELVDHAGVHHGDAVGHGQRLTLVVGHVHERDADLALDALEFHLHLLAQLQVERAERLVEQQRPRPVDQGPGQRDALLLAAGHLPRGAFLHAGERDDLHHLADAAADLGLGDLLALQAEGHVLVHGEVREQRVRLEDHVDVALVRGDPGDVAPVQVDRPGGGLLEPRDHPHGRGLAAAGRAEQGEELPRADGEVGPPYGMHPLAMRQEVLVHAD